MVTSVVWHTEWKADRKGDADGTRAGLPRSPPQGITESDDMYAV